MGWKLILRASFDLDQHGRMKTHETERRKYTQHDPFKVPFIVHAPPSVPASSNYSITNRS